MYQTPKTATTAGLLGIFLGAVGAHNWYLGDKKKGIIHVSMFGAGIILEVIAAIVMPKDTFSVIVAVANGGTFLPTVLAGLGGAVVAASGIWGFIEGIIIISQGDAGLASKGYAVAAPVPPQGQYDYGPQPVQPMQPMQPQQPYYGQPMPQQPVPPQGFTEPMPQSEPIAQQSANQPTQPENPAGGINGQ